MCRLKSYINKSTTTCDGRKSAESGREMEKWRGEKLNRSYVKRNGMTHRRWRRVIVVPPSLVHIALSFPFSFTRWNQSAIQMLITCHQPFDVNRIFFAFLLQVVACWTTIKLRFESKIILGSTLSWLKSRKHRSGRKCRRLKSPFVCVPSIRAKSTAMRNASLKCMITPRPSQIPRCRREPPIPSSASTLTIPTGRMTWVCRLMTQDEFSFHLHFRL